MIICPYTKIRNEKLKNREAEFMLDISEFLGSVSIFGISRNMVRLNPNRHVVVHAKWKDEVDWKGLCIGPFSYWKIIARKLAGFNADEGIFSLPHKSDKYYSEIMNDKEILEKAGLQFT